MHRFRCFPNFDKIDSLPDIVSLIEFLFFASYIIKKATIDLYTKAFYSFFSKSLHIIIKVAIFAANLCFIMSEPHGL